MPFRAVLREIYLYRLMAVHRAADSVQPVQIPIWASAGMPEQSSRLILVIMEELITASVKIKKTVFADVSFWERIHKNQPDLQPAF
jgi:hypothetical protein